jgi:hypothetical protein
MRGKRVQENPGEIKQGQILRAFPAKEFSFFFLESNEWEFMSRLSEMEEWSNSR